MTIAYDIQPRSRVRMHTRISLLDGTVVEDTFADDEPVDFVMGDGSLVRGLELALYGLRPGQEQTLTLAPEQAFGPHDPEKIHELPRGDFPAEIALEPGLIIGFDTPEGEEIPGAVLEVGAQTVKVDFNHPLAGKPITFEVRILEVEPPAIEDEEG